MNTLKSLATAFAMIGATIAAPALAEPIMLDAGDIGESFTVTYDGFADGQTIDGLSAETVFTLTGVTGSTYTFDYSVTNTTNSGVGSRISSFAFNTDPDISSAVSTGVYDNAVTDSNYPNGIGTVDVCFKAARTNSCAGNREGLLAGESGSGSLTLNFLTAPTTLTLDDFFVRYQSVRGVKGVSSASGQQTSTTSTSTTTSSTSTTTTSTSGGTPVPAPGGMLGLFALALIGFGLVRRRPRSAQRALGNPAYA
ncbi:PEP-CTERM sorting domain-containing protein [Erythrobacter insulae]|uniref:PEP-CTERM sorting domain-containing protein n=1 Tax=Erythrobacter insulae TaxID=2584124 RepID=A0A547PCD0_9SPHN|nr:cistern family PEP-CTERM protein [Erythrobacter insulae]TRD11800.1 PEP-CTERM sorting domain-containing protein [Erythrobacter insulae]